MSDLDDIEAAKLAIRELTAKEHATTTKGLLLSKLGQELAKQPRVRGALGGRKLAEFIREELADSVQVLTSPENKIVQIALPASVMVEGDPMPLFPKRDESKGLKDIPRYSPALWAAFSKPLTTEHTRLVGLQPQIHFEDVQGALEDTAKKIVPQSFIVDEAVEADPDKRVRLIGENIARWLDSNGIDAKEVSKSTTPHLPQAAAKYKDSPLASLLESLPESDLKRIQMPLDIVAKLLRRT